MTRRVLVCVGTRPEAIKMAPVIQALTHGPLTPVVAVTGQHEALAIGGLAAFDLRPDRVLAEVPPGTDLPGLLARLIVGTRELIDAVGPAAVLVHGDTASALGAALAATYAGVPVGHVEAGLRTGDPTAPFPEELHRVLIDRLATWWFAPTAIARDRLLAEGADADRVHRTGNPVVDALLQVSAAVGRRPWAAFPELAPLAGPAVHRILVTAHRRESWGEPLSRICDAVATLAGPGTLIAWSLHPNPAVSGPVRAALGELPGVHLLPPLGYPSFVRLMMDADLVLTDSGGVQEEAAVLGRPTLVLRDGTERPEVLQTGVVRLVGTRTDAVVAAAREWLAAPPVATDAAPLGDGHAGRRIASALQEALCG